MICTRCGAEVPEASETAEMAHGSLVMASMAETMQFDLCAACYFPLRDALRAYLDGASVMAHVPCPTKTGEDPGDGTRQTTLTEWGVEL